MIRLAETKDIPKIIAITKACALHMSHMGIHQWNEHYPTPGVFGKDVEMGQLHVLEINGQVIGTVVVSDVMDEEYKPVKWLALNGKNSYVHRLCIHPEHQGKGYAQRLMDFAETLSRKKGCISVRLDTFSQNPRNQRFYEQRGYQRLGDIYFPKQSEYPFHCYELVF
ncbi:MAG: GNAT family N-acetyltransferase [Bacteroidota bacterium]